MVKKEIENKEAAVIPADWKTRLGGRYPDRKFENDTDYESALSEFMDGVEANENSFKEANDQMIELLRMNPELAELIDCMLKDHVPFRVALVKHYGPEDLTPQEGDDDYDGWKGNYDERRKSLDSRDQMLKDMTENETASMAVIEDFCKEKGMTDEQREAFLDACDAEIADVVRKKVSQKFLETMWKGLHAEELAADAAREAEVKARNIKIEAKREKEQSKATGDSIPSPAQTGDGVKENTKEKGFLDDVLGRRNFI